MYPLTSSGINVVMFTIYFIAMASDSNSSPSEDIPSGTDLSNIHTKDEEQVDTTDWMPAQQKKLQHMVEFHEEYQHVFGEKASIHTIMKNRISHMNPPMPDSVCKEEMQNTTIDNNVIVEYITDTQGRRVKKLKPLLIKSEPNREYTQHVHSDDNLPNIPEDNFLQKREVTVDSYSETISSESSSEDRTITAETENSMSSMEDNVEDKTNIKENNATEIETTLHQIATSLQGAAEGYMSLASHVNKLDPYELPQVIAQIPPPPINVPMTIRKALDIDGEDKVVNHLLHGEYEMTNMSWSKLQKKYSLSKNKIYSALKGKRRPRGLQYRQMRKCTRKLETTTSFTSSETN